VTEFLRLQLTSIGKQQIAEIYGFEIWEEWWRWRIRKAGGISTRV
jgi:hypothetical protein